jgi:ABC-type phosphate/phosphonate transport system substrate-binding protein
VNSWQPPARQLLSRSVFPSLSLALLLISVESVCAQGNKIDVLKIGNSGTLGGAASAEKEKSNLDTLKAFIKDETGLNNEIIREKNWQELAEKMSKGELQLGAFQGYEFAWAKEKYPDLKPLAVAVNVYPYPVAYVVTKSDNPAKDFAGLKGQGLAIPSTGPPFLRFFVDRQSDANGKKAEEFFSKITTPDNVEDALDDAVDGKEGVVVDRAALEAFKRRKPARFKQLKEVAKSPPFPPTVIAYYDAKLDDATLTKFKDGLLGADKKERGQTLLTLFRLTKFETPPEDFDKALNEARKTYPPTDGKPK